MKRKLVESVEVNTQISDAEASDAEAPVKKRAPPRNKQAVTKTNKASTIAM